jgi:hypothetical protein
VGCGNQTCSGNDVCCSMLNINTNNLALACGNGTTCTAPPGSVGPSFRISCDQHADCVGNEVCCSVGNNVNSGEISCRVDCTAEAISRETPGNPNPANFVVGQICASPAGPIFLQCPAGQTCRTTVSTVPSQYSVCR